MDPSKAASSNVTVEYTDPSGLFPVVQPIIESKLPLKNLHWKSPTRPVRSIESLRIGFSPAHPEASERKSSSDATGAIPHRRHQIPGLRQTPYLKIYLLRCDDNDTYKATARKTLREWIKAQGSSSTSQPTGSGQEKHDAFEWLILHVVQDGDGVDKTPAPTSKWGRSTSTVLEKIKADFNGSSKTAIDRVAQLRLPKEGTPTKSPDFADQLEDLIDKVKKGILASFDLRVAQYEEDIKEKDSQRSLPGWNFCTFFILKEGLARGFENVGLFEDALLGYDELSIGLDAAIRDQLQDNGEKHGNALLSSSKIWVERAKNVLESGDPTDDPDADEDPLKAIQPEDYPLSSTKLPYREMILASDISIFDFRTYIFSRQLTLLLRAARAPCLTGNETQPRDKKPEDLIVLSEICARSSDFITLAARTLRYGLECGLADVDHEAKADTINNLVSSWAYAAALQILHQTFTSHLALPESSLHGVTQNNDTPSSTVSAAETRSDVPRRSSSLISSSNTRPSRAMTQDLSDTVGLLQRRLTLDHPKPAPGPAPKTGSEQLASGRGELFLLARRCLEEIAQRRGWSEKWTDLALLFDDSHRSKAGGLSEVSLDENDASKLDSDCETVQQVSLRGIELRALKAGLKSKAAYLSLYEDLTDHIIRHHIVANRTNSAETALAEIAILRYRQANYEAAASYFHQMAPFYGSKLWVVLEGSMLELYARCLKELKRNEDFVRVMLRLLAKFAAYAQSKLSVRQRALSTPPSILQLEQLAGYVSDLFQGAQSLQKDVTASMLEFFTDLRVDPAIRFYDDKDGFQIQLSLRFLLGPQIEIDSIKVRLVSANGSQTAEHWIEASGQFLVKSSMTKVLIDSSTTLQGKYYVDRLEMKSGNIIFSFSSGQHPALPVGFRETDDDEEADRRPYIYCYPPPQGLQVKVVSPHLIDLEAMRTLELELNSGRNDIKNGTIRVRPATAGLRLRIAETEIVDGKLEVTANNDSGIIEFAQLPPQSFVRLRIPYTVEETFTTLSARTEVGYETEQGRFGFSSMHSIVATLPISVNVQDIFKDELLFSRFTISPAMLIPLRITNCNLPSSDIYEVHSSMTGPVALDVFPKQPASLVYKIRPSGNTATAPAKQRNLRLRVDFTCVDDECLDAVEKRFVSAIQCSPFNQYSTLLTSHIVSAFRSQLSNADMEVIGLVREVEMLSYNRIRWEELLGALKERTEDVRQWLKTWHETNPIIRLPTQPSIPTRSIMIPVEIPEIQVVHTAELQLLPNADGSNPGSSHAAVGQMISAELCLRHTRRWCPPANQEHAGQPLECSYELHANPELWLLGGRRRGNFLARDGETTRFTVLLLPQKPGHLLLPGLEIRTFTPTPQQHTLSPAATDPATGAPAAAAQRRPIPSEVDYRNHGETVLVLPDLRKTTVSLSASGSPGGSSWLVDSERRAEVH
ncbi:hypothetical protein N7462_005461 [Penicillium macrosclerotiorum]|uniref:uncharacterized protein n=1 Tax=Penicillium macrosclerotiorum TaxID=303699 RepID=UPI002548FD21|nr:uncharacterized protein N7462_005461 [Penicillium macrosclerotiorum]KAJ5682296.1 hypothetical protein N7462_005461 [Penicillium macrosclerotiorum]